MQRLSPQLSATSRLRAVFLSTETFILLLAILLSSAGEAQRPKSRIPSKTGSRYANKVLIGTDTGSLWLDTRTGKAHLLSESKGECHGFVPGDADPSDGTPRTIWLLSRPFDGGRKNASATLIKLNAVTGLQLDSVSLPFRFAKELVRLGERLVVLSGGDGSIMELEFPSMQLLRHLQGAFGADDGLVSAAPAKDGWLWLLLCKRKAASHARDELEVTHGYQSELVKVDEAGKIQMRVLLGRSEASGLAEWGNFLVVLDSEAAALKLVHERSGAVTTLLELGEEDLSLGGLAVAHHLAIFGIHRQSAEPAASAEVAVFNLTTQKLQGRMVVSTGGRINAIASPEQWKTVGAITSTFGIGKETLDGTDQGRMAAARCSSLSHTACRRNPFCELNSASGKDRRLCRVCVVPPCLSAARRTPQPSGIPAAA